MSERETLTGRTCVITGANTGIGRVTAMEIARLGAHVIMACRSEARARPVAEEIRSATGNERVEVVSLDLASLESVRRCAEELLARETPLHILINNAGLAGQRGLTEDGFELAFGVNHLGHFLLTRLLLDRLTESAPSRVVHVASKAHIHAPGIDFDAVRRPTAHFSGYPEYQVSKLANVLFNAELARRTEGTGLHTYAVHPGVVASDIWRKVPWPFRAIMKLNMISNEEGARTTIFCATSPDVAGDSGLYYDECRAREPSAVARDPDLARQLWERSEEWTGL